MPHWKKDKKRGRLVQSIMASDKKMYLRWGSAKDARLDLWSWRESED